MEIHPDLRRFVELPQDGHEDLRRQFLRTCEMLDLSITHFDKNDEDIEEKIDSLTALHHRCYGHDYSLEESREYVRRCTNYVGFRAFTLVSAEKEIMAVVWIDDGKPYSSDVELMREEYMRQTGSNLLVSTVQMMTHPGIRNEGIQQGLTQLVTDFCNQAFNAPALLIRRIGINNGPSERVAEKAGFAPAASLTEMRAGYGRYWSLPPIDPYGLSAHVNDRRKEENRQVWETTHFPRYPARELGSIAVVTSFAPHEGREIFLQHLKSFAMGEKEASMFGFADNDLFGPQTIDRADVLSVIDNLEHANQTITLQNFSTIRCVTWWHEDQVLRVEVRVPPVFNKENEPLQALIAPNLDVVGAEMLTQGHDKMKFTINDVALKQLNQLIDIHSVLKLGDLAETGNPDLTLNLSALNNHMLRDKTLVSINIATLRERFSALAWLKDQYKVQPEGPVVIGLTEPEKQSN